MGLCQMGVFCGVELSDHGRGHGAAGSDGGFGLANPHPRHSTSLYANLFPDSSSVSAAMVFFFRAHTRSQWGLFGNTLPSV